MFNLYLKDKPHKMKTISVITLLFAISLKIYAQDCTQYLYMKKGKTIEMTSYNGIGDEMGKSVTNIADVTTANGTTTATVNAEHFDKTGKSNGKSTITYKCNGGEFMFDISSANMKMKSGYIAYPAAMKVGQHFDDKEFKMEMNFGGRSMETTMRISDRQVVGKESITTSAGTWECLKITYKIGTMAPGMSAPARLTDVTEWFVPNFAIIQTKTGMMTSKLTAIK